MIRFFTHFDRTYEAQGRVMIDSLFRHVSEPIKVCILWLDELPPQLFRAGGLIEIVKLNPFLQYDQRYREARENRSWKEFCWSLEVALIHEALRGAEQHGDHDQILVYVDADSYFFADPIPGIRDAMERGDVALTPHHFPPGQEHRERGVGKFNFGFGIFRNCQRVREVVSEWLDKTLEGCHEGGANDQTYLDEWPAKLGERLVEMSRGWNVGPWQLAEVKCNPLTIAGEPLVSWHMHEMRRGTGRNPIVLRGEAWNRSGYVLHESVIEHVYRPYEAELEKLL